MPSRRSVLIVPVLILVAGSASCSTPSRPVRVVGAAEEAGAPAKAEWRIELERLAARQAVRRAAGAEIPAELDVPGLAPAPASDARARTPLAKALDEFLARPLPVAAFERPGKPPDEIARDAALRLYVSARMALAEGRAAEAVSQLQSATRLDPGSARLWEAYGEAQLRAGLARPAAESYARAVALGSDDPLTLLALGRSAHSAGDHGAAAAYLARVSERTAGTADAGMWAVANVALGESLLELGYLEAGAEALAAGVDLPPRFGAPTSLRDELGDIYRRRSDLWRAVGDACCRLERYEEALQAYAHAAAFPSLDPGGLLARRLYAALRIGQPARAAIDLIDALIPEDGPARIEDRHIALIRSLSAHSPAAGPPMARALSARRAALVAGGAPTGAGLLTRAAAAALPDRDAAELLKEWLRQHPTDAACLAELMARSAHRGAAAVAAALADLVEGAPMQAAAIARGAAAPSADAGTRTGAAELVRGLSRERRGLGASLLLAALLAETNDAEGAARVVTELRTQRPTDVAVASLAVSIGAGSGRWDLALPALGTLETADAPAGVRARALAAVQRFGGAMAVLRSAEPGSLSAADLRLAAEIADHLSLAAEQEAFLRSAIRADPYDDGAYLPLLALYADSGPLRDRRKLMETLRGLREAVPSSRAIRTLRAQELLEAGRLGLAQPELLALAEENPYDDAPLRMLAAAWNTQSTPPASLLAQADAQVGAILNAHPDAPWAAVAASALSLARADSSGAEAILKQRMRGEADPVLAPALEALLRSLGRGEEADVRASARLEAAPPTIGATVELATWRAQSGRVNAATELLRDRLPEGAVLTPAQAGPLLAALEDVGRAAMSRPTPEALDAAAGLLGEALPRVVAAPLSLHLVGIGMLVETEPPPLEAIFAAASLASVQHPAEAIQLHDAVTARLVERQRPGAALAYLSRMILGVQEPDVRLVRRWLLLSATAGTGEDAVAAVEFLLERGLAPSLFGEDLELTPGEIAYQLGVVATTSDNDEAAIALYERALEREPGHAWAANNLGYTLLERDGPTERAVELIEQAYTALPGEPNVIDSLGWLRYKQDVIVDEVDAEGTLLREGAVTLLGRALELSPSKSPTMWDHLGDALWAAGRHDEAVRAWRAAEVAAVEIVRGSGRQGRPELPQSVVGRHAALISGAREKQGAAARAQAPPVSPIPGREAEAPPAPVRDGARQRRGS